jgi:FixJ family two-component response regulator
MNETLSNMKIMVVDDDQALCDALESTLKATGFRVGKFSSAEEYLGWPDRESASCLILDLRLPGMSGIELQHVLRETGNAVPIVFLTAHGDTTIRDVVMRAGALGFLTKPVRRNVPRSTGVERGFSEIGLARLRLLICRRRVRRRDSLRNPMKTLGSLAE